MRTQTTIIKPDIFSILEKEGIALKQRGKDFWGLCPLHSEKTPSFKVDSERQTYHCFGCGAGGDVITFIQKLKGYSFKDALSYLGILPSKHCKPNTREIKKHEMVKSFRQWCDQHYEKCCEFYRLWQDVKENVKTIEDAERFSKFYHAEPIITHRMDILSYGSNQDKFELFREVVYANGN